MSHYFLGVIKCQLSNQDFIFSCHNCLRFNGRKSGFLCDDLSSNPSTKPIPSRKFQGILRNSETRLASHLVGNYVITSSNPPHPILSPYTILMIYPMPTDWRMERLPQWISLNLPSFWFKTSRKKQIPLWATNVRRLRRSSVPCHL